MLLVIHPSGAPRRFNNTECQNYLFPLLLLLLLLHALLYLTQQAGWVGGESLETVLLRQLSQPSRQLSVGHLNFLELQLALSQLDTTVELKLGLIRL